MFGPFTGSVGAETFTIPSGNKMFFDVLTVPIFSSSNEDSITSFVFLTNHSKARKQLEIETLAFCVLSRMIGKQLVESCPRWMALLHEY